ncbi:hypothetical protein [Streptomyces sp. NPDC050485]|uniref:hypothetical protein n=1 Tax=Streptomyces sp. NPDC050485 TaxID=3365617 RepID=UPI00379B50FB
MTWPDDLSAPAEPDRLALLPKHEGNVRARIDDLNASLEVIHGKASTYEQHLRGGTAVGLWSPTPPR